MPDEYDHRTTAFAYYTIQITETNTLVGDHSTVQTSHTDLLPQIFGQALDELHLGPVERAIHCDYCRIRLISQCPVDEGSLAGLRGADYDEGLADERSIDDVLTGLSQCDHPLLHLVYLIKGRHQSYQQILSRYPLLHSYPGLAL